MFSSDNSSIAKEIPNRGDMNLATIKKDIESFYLYFEHNFKNYREFVIKTFKTTLNDADRDNLTLVGKPTIEFPIFESYVSRLRGEFSKQRPTFNVCAAEGLKIGRIDDEYLKLMKVLQAHITEIVADADAEGFSNDIYGLDCVPGGFGVARISTDYVSNKSFEQRIKLERVIDPTKCGFDPLAKLRHKGDGRFCFELYPMTQEEFAQEFGEEKARRFNFTRAIESFNWTYANEDKKIVLVGDYYTKVLKNKMLVRLAPHGFNFADVMFESEYNAMIKEWPHIEQVPAILEKRKTVEVFIDRYQVCQDEKLRHQETFYRMLPLIFFDGNSAMIQQNPGNAVHQLTKPFCLHADGAQRLFNFAGQSIGQELEDMPRVTFTIPVTGIPKQYVSRWQRPQLAGALPYNQYDPMNPDKQLNPPDVVPRPPTPPIVENTFNNSQNIIQQVLGSYDALLGINGNDISGKAIEKGAMQSNAAAQPYYDNFIVSMQQVANFILTHIPLIYKTPRTIPVRLPNGKRDYQVINAPYPKVDKQKEMLQKAQEMGLGGMQTQVEDDSQEDAESEEMENAIMFNYDPEELNVRVEPGVNAHIQKQASFELLTRAMDVSPTLAEFFNRQGLPVILESLDLPGIEALKSMVEQFQAQMEAERQQAAQQPQEVDKIVQAEMQKAQMEMQSRMAKIEADFQLGLAKIAEMQQEAEIKKLEVELKAKEMQAKLNMEDERQAAENTRAALDVGMELARMQHERSMSEKPTE